MHAYFSVNAFFLVTIHVSVGCDKTPLIVFIKEAQWTALLEAISHLNLLTCPYHMWGSLCPDGFSLVPLPQHMNPQESIISTVGISTAQKSAQHLILSISVHLSLRVVYQLS